MQPQPNILADVPPHASFLFLDVRHEVAPAAAASEISGAFQPDTMVVGLGPAVVAALGGTPAAALPALVGPTVSIPSTPTDLFVRITGDDPGQVLHRERALLARLPSMQVADRVAGFMFGASRDLSGYVDGTENPTGSAAAAAAFQPDGSSVVAVQRWVHDLDTFDGFGPERQNATFGRDRASNEELDDAPTSAHVKRTAQEDFSPEAFLVRRSMPWRDARGAGLVFVSFSATLDPFVAQLRRMVGLDDGVVDGLFSFTRPVTGATWWCPPMRDGRLQTS